MVIIIFWTLFTITNNNIITITAELVKARVEVAGVEASLEIWDTSGQERYHSLCPLYYRGANAAIVVFDIANDVSTMSKCFVRCPYF